MLRHALCLSVFSGLLAAAPMVWAQAETAEKAPPATTAQPAQAEADPFAVPEGNDSKVLLLFIQRLANTPPAERTPDGVRAHLTKLDGALATVLSRQIEEELFINTAALRLQILSILPQFGDNAAVARQQKFLDELRNDKRPAVQRMVTQQEIAARVAKIPGMSPDERSKLIDELVSAVKNAPATDNESLGFAVQTLMETAQELENLDTASALKAYESLGAALKPRNDERFKRLITMTEAKARLLSLPGKPLPISGTTIEGDAFDIKSLEGKVVLVDFWATWCGPCLQELPHVKEMYEAYNDKGFEVVGISLDDNKQALEKFLDDQDIEWVTLFSNDPEKQGWENPLVQHYGITGIPMAILLDQKGNVVSMKARGENLTAELKKLLGAPATEDAAKSKVAVPAK
ncbi:TlpA family protein disulfide reductase [Planctomicrobium sp. SH664]|uniref:TlpA family protein disulfide reductase n=1 Tax=Planctomicrobium sp. SH664 TaxID=3448125 RepID=UPI003F5C33F3